MNITEAYLKLVYEDMILDKFTDSNQIVKYLLRDRDDPISEAYAFFGKEHISTQVGDSVEKQFAEQLKKYLGKGIFFKDPNVTPNKEFVKAQDALEKGLINWYRGSKAMDLQHIDYVVNIAGEPKTEDIEIEAKTAFAKELGADDINSEDFLAFWNDPQYDEVKHKYIDEFTQKAQSNKKVDVKTFEVKSYKADIKKIFGSNWTMAEIVSKHAHKGWVYGIEDFIAFRDADNYDKKQSVKEPNGWLIIKRADFAAYCDKKVDKKTVVKDKRQGNYKLYQRVNSRGEYDANPFDGDAGLVTYIDLIDAKSEGVNMVFWKD